MENSYLSSEWFKIRKIIAQVRFFKEGRVDFFERKGQERGPMTIRVTKINGAESLSWMSYDYVESSSISLFSFFFYSRLTPHANYDTSGFLLSVTTDSQSLDRMMRSNFSIISWRKKSWRPPLRLEVSFFFKSNMFLNS